MPTIERATLVGVPTMLVGALGQLFVDLDKIPELNRSEYERALHQELLELANRSRPLATAQILSSEVVRAAVEFTPELHMKIDLRPTDTVRMRCDAALCPLKRQ